MGRTLSPPWILLISETIGPSFRCNSYAPGFIAHPPNTYWTISSSSPHSQYGEAILRTRFRKRNFRRLIRPILAYISRELSSFRNVLCWRRLLRYGLQGIDELGLELKLSILYGNSGVDVGCRKERGILTRMAGKG